jgi:hypothetical protein
LCLSPWLCKGFFEGSSQKQMTFRAGIWAGTPGQNWKHFDDIQLIDLLTSELLSLFFVLGALFYFSVLGIPKVPLSLQSFGPALVFILFSLKGCAV